MKSHCSHKPKLCVHRTRPTPVYLFSLPLRAACPRAGTPLFVMGDSAGVISAGPNAGGAQSQCERYGLQVFARCSARACLLLLRQFAGVFLNTYSKPNLSPGR